MTHDPLDQVTRLLRGAVADAGDTATLPTGRDAAIAKLTEALRARAEQRNRRRVISRFAMAASVLALVGGSAFAARAYTHGSVAAEAKDLGRMRDPAGAFTAMRDGHNEALAAGERVVEGTEILTPTTGEAHLDFDSGTQVTLGTAARVRLVEQSKKKRFALETGSLFAKVAKLGADEKFVVATPDAEIEVRGTAFRVSIAPSDPGCAGGTPTRLEVTEGTVVVRQGGSETRVSAGDHWPSCPTEMPATVAATPAPAAHPVATAPTTPITMAASGATPDVSPVAAPARTTASSHLSEQNDLFDQAMRDKRAGRNAAAVTSLDKLLTTYPSGPLSESAAVERMRLLSPSDRVRAAAAARDYMRRWPRGFARAEAEALAGSP